MAESLQLWEFLPEQQLKWASCFSKLFPQVVWGGETFKYCLFSSSILACLRLSPAKKPQGWGVILPKETSKTKPKSHGREPSSDSSPSPPPFPPCGSVGRCSCGRPPCTAPRPSAPGSSQRHSQPHDSPAAHEATTARGGDGNATDVTTRSSSRQVRSWYLCLFLPVVYCSRGTQRALLGDLDNQNTSVASSSFAHPGKIYEKLCPVGMDFL